MMHLSSFERWGTGDIEITNVRFLDQSGIERSNFKTNDSMTIEMAYQAHRPIADPEFGLAIYNHEGIHINGPNSRLGGLDTGVVTGHGIVQYQIDRLPLLPGKYRMTAAIHDSRRSMAYDYHKEAYIFEVSTGGTQEYHGLLQLPAHWKWNPE